MRFRHNFRARFHRELSLLKSPQLRTLFKMSKSYNLEKVKNDNKQILSPTFLPIGDTVPIVLEVSPSVPNKKEESKGWKALYGGMFLILLSTFLYANVLILAKVLKER